MFCRSCSSVLFQTGNLTMFSPMLLSFVWLALFSFNSCWLYSVLPFCRVVYTVVVYICSVYLVVRLLFSCARLLTVSNCLDGYACWLYSVVLLHPVVDCIQWSVVYHCWLYSVVQLCIVVDSIQLSCRVQLVYLSNYKQIKKISPVIVNLLHYFPLSHLFKTQKKPICKNKQFKNIISVVSVVNTCLKM